MGCSTLAAVYDVVSFASVASDPSRFFCHRLNSFAFITGHYEQRSVKQGKCPPDHSPMEGEW
eukprot:2112335-Amphidinium_carterae.1